MEKQPLINGPKIPKSTDPPSEFPLVGSVGHFVPYDDYILLKTSYDELSRNFLEVVQERNNLLEQIQEFKK